MSSGKPKGIARKLAALKTNYFDKLWVSLFGVAGTSPLSTLWIESQLTPEAIKDMEINNPFPPKLWDERKPGMLEIGRQARAKLAAMATEALEKKDLGFFEQITALMKLEGKPTSAIADPLGAHVLMIWASLKLWGQTGSSSQVTELLAENFPREIGYDDGQIRTIMRNLGIPGAGDGGH